MFRSDFFALDMNYSRQLIIAGQARVMMVFNFILKLNISNLASRLLENCKIIITIIIIIATEKVS
jgi:hypothetical protein